MDGTHFDFDETTRQLQARLDQLEAEHRLLDEQVTAQQMAGADMITLQRLKREKLRGAGLGAGVGLAVGAGTVMMSLWAFLRRGRRYFSHLTGGRLNRQI